MFDSGLLSSSYLGVFNLDIGKAYAESLYFLVDKLKQILELVSKDSSKTGSLVGLQGVIREYEKELASHRGNLDSEDFNRRAMKVSTFDADFRQSNNPQQSALLGFDGAQSKLGKSSFDPKVQIVVEARYELNPDGSSNFARELDPKVSEEYETLGYDSSAKTSNKHYRLRVDRPLEETDFVLCSAFLTVPISVGKQLQTENSSFFSFLSKEEKHREAGRFKGAVSVMKEHVLRDLQNLNLPQQLAQFDLPHTPESWSSSKMDKDILSEVQVRVRLYLLEAHIHESLDIGSDCDVYTKIYLGEKELFDNKEKRIDDRQDPKFYACFEFKTSIPGASVLKIKFFDYDPVGFDDYIGVTQLDLEDRYFDRRWRDLREVPIEKRDIRENCLGALKGTVKLWVEIDRVDDKARIQRPLRDISPVPARNFELRVVVWEARDVPIDDPEGLGDIYVKCTFPSLGKPLSPDMSADTDTHWRSLGFASFNWRMVFRLSTNMYIPKEKYSLQVQVWDKDLLTANDYLSSYQFSSGEIHRLLMSCLSTGKSAHYSLQGSRSKDNKVEVRTVANGNRADATTSTVVLSIECLTEEE